jgi:hypothetical protein
MIGKTLLGAQDRNWISTPVSDLTPSGIRPHGPLGAGSLLSVMQQPAADRGRAVRPLTVQ